MWSASVPGPRHDWQPEQNRSEVEDAFARLAHLAHGAQGMRFETCTQKCTRASAEAQPPSRVREDSVDERGDRL